ncbi:hypothetical protein SAMN05421768_103213 [Chryseobacterium joostei]|uniref:Uncharacterized protein n=1 Tax=Chryseobacterium joostei TaxID=112234 RepID=A0A1N7I831_9FLAO|nr:hypothetical protein SAMN05421768_103213 [Chryseobacterium joostei]
MGFSWGAKVLQKSRRFNNRTEEITGQTEDFKIKNKQKPLIQINIIVHIEDYSFSLFLK